MPRVKRGIMTRKRHNRVLVRAKGYWGSRSNLYRQAHEAVMHAGQYAYRDRRVRKRDFRKLWIARINAAARMNGISYSMLMSGLKKKNVGLDRRALAAIALTDPAGFQAVASLAKT